VKHGTNSCYRNYGCRCKRCRAANAAWQRAARSRRAACIPEHVHGTDNGYRNYRCRCAPCRAAGTAATMAGLRRREAAA